jgi:hypothetical protein
MDGKALSFRHTDLIPGSKPGKQPVSKVDRSPVRFSVYHGQVIEVQSSNVPIVDGGGRFFLGFGDAVVETAVIRTTSVWTREHGTGQETRWELGEPDLPVRAGHNVSFLWANGSPYALHNHNTSETLYRPLPREIFPFRRLWFAGFFGLIKLILVGLLGAAFLPRLVGLSLYPMFALVGRTDLWTPRHLDPVLGAINPYMVATLVIFCIVRNWQARAYNRKLGSRINQELQEGV